MLFPKYSNKNFRYTSYGVNSKFRYDSFLILSIWFISISTDSFHSFSNVSVANNISSSLRNSTLNSKFFSSPASVRLLEPVITDPYPWGWKLSSLNIYILAWIFCLGCILMIIFLEAISSINWYIPSSTSLSYFALCILSLIPLKNSSCVCASLGLNNKPLRFASYVSLSILIPTSILIWGVCSINFRILK